MKKLLLWSLPLLIINSMQAYAMKPTYGVDSNVASEQHEAATQPLTLNVENGLPINLNNARVKVGAVNTWIDLGTIRPGTNSFKIPGKLNSVPGLLQVQEPNGQWMNGMFTKTANDNVINIRISQSNDNDANTNINRNAMANTVAMTVISEGSKEPIQHFSPTTAANKNNSWSATCYTFGTGVSFVACDIYSNPQMYFSGIGGGFNGGIAKGTWGSDMSPSQLVNLPEGDWGLIAALVYTHIWAPHGWFNGGGIGAGGTGGNQAKYETEGRLPPDPKKIIGIWKIALE